MRSERPRHGLLPRALLVAAVAVWLGTTPLAGSASRLASPGPEISDSCADPVINTFGLEFRNDQLWTMTQDGTLTRLSNCQPVQVISVQAVLAVVTFVLYPR